MRAQVSFEALINMGLLMMILGMIVWSVDQRTSALSSGINRDFFEKVCRRIRGAVLMSLIEPNVTVRTVFDEGFNVSFNDSYGFTILRGDEEGLCSLFTDNLINLTGSGEFMLTVEDELSVHSTGGGVEVW